MKDMSNGSKCNEGLLGYEVKQGRHGSIIWWFYEGGQLHSKDRIGTIYICNSDLHHLLILSLHV